MFDVKTVVNRRNVPVEVQFDGACIVFKPHEKKPLPARVALNIIPQSALQLNLETGVTSVYGLGIEGHKHYIAEPLDGELADENPIEILDRSDSPILTETEPMALTADGPKALGKGKREKVPTKLLSTGVVHPRGPQNHGEWSDSRVVHKNA